ncbi:MAG: hypothetical protein ACR2GD_01385 [Pyrinomonadaceae bacterium]
MPYSSTAELYFICAMMFLILSVCAVACFFFIRTFQREKKEKEEARKMKERKKASETSKTE